MTTRPAGPGAAVEILAIGDELLLGATVDTNSAWIARRLAAEGIVVVRKTTVGDDVALITQALDDALRRTGTVLCTGGLGPTPDDLTRHAVAAQYGRRIVVDEAWVQILRERHAARGMEMPAINRVQGEHPEGARLLHNARGTAPGIVVHDDAIGTTILLPGVPHEMRGLMEDDVVPLLRERLQPTSRLVSRLLRTAGLSEALLAERVADIAAGVTAPLSLAYLPHVTGVDLRVTAPATHEADAVALQDFLRQRLAADVYAADETDLADVVGGMLKERGLTVALAESCTGGLLAKRLTDGAGASAYLHAGFVTYANDAKRDQLGVPAETLALHGAVSELCARQMAEGARQVASADVAISITGVAGPGGGSEEKPVGTVWIAVALPAGTHARLFRFSGDRGIVRDRSAQAALDMLRRRLSDDADQPGASQRATPDAG
ncbi:MAG TPA: competence/damage-inducible protein A [Longimicrobiales bacterium]|nr:competence/damage-inducible protein A [Longimicrobiales bacterium]